MKKYYDKVCYTNNIFLLQDIDLTFVAKVLSVREN